MSNKQEDANLILRLYELRREETMRKARDWFVTDFNPESTQDLLASMVGEHNAAYRMVTTYWDMAAAFVNHGAIDEQLCTTYISSTSPSTHNPAVLRSFAPHARALHLTHLEQIGGA